MRVVLGVVGAVAGNGGPDPRGESALERNTRALNYCYS